MINTSAVVGKLKSFEPFSQDGNVVSLQILVDELAQLNRPKFRIA